MILLIMPTVGQMIKQILHSRISTYRDLSQHKRHCIKRLNVVSISSSQSVTKSKRAEVTNVSSPVTSFVWGERDGTLFTDELNEA